MFDHLKFVKSYLDSREKAEKRGKFIAGFEGFSYQYIMASCIRTTVCTRVGGEGKTIVLMNYDGFQVTFEINYMKW